VPAPGSGGIVIFSPADRNWLFLQAVPQMQDALNQIWQREIAIQPSQLEIDSRIAALQAELDARIDASQAEIDARLSAVQSSVQDVVSATQAQLDAALASVAATVTQLEASLAASQSDDDLQFQAIQTEVTGLTTSVEFVLAELQTLVALFTRPVAIEIIVAGVKKGWNSMDVNDVSFFVHAMGRDAGGVLSPLATTDASTWAVMAPDGVTPSANATAVADPNNPTDASFQQINVTPTGDGTLQGPFTLVLTDTTVNLTGTSAVLTPTAGAPTSLDIELSTN
jgi:hypothetical protein